ncbi:hypothetical protein BXZ70DRAFT_54848 [Cristinia sonorae]|uniref:F-box domain-containing protein n=1 Tax=Cristinia sonorae TaxID=1940300 RepID=A0A8K0UR83_9AGAR|nr:hypothetical protein BXZ70DRAFT_54848 [Cristinia sonorae]
MEILYIPPETVDHIISFVPLNDKKTLASCSLSSRTFSAIAQPYLFRQFNVDGGERKRLKDLLAVACFLSRLAKHIWYISIKCSTSDDNDMVTKPLLLSELMAALELLPNFRSVRLDSLALFDDTPNTTSFYPVHIPHLRIHCDSSANEHSFLKLLSSLGDVDRLHITGLPSSDFPLAFATRTVDILEPFLGNYPQLSAITLMMRVKDIRIGPSFGSDIDSSLLLLGALCRSPTMYSLTFASIYIDSFIIAADVGCMVRSCTALEYLELDLRLPYYNKRTKEPLRDAFEWHKLCLSKCPTLRRLNVIGASKSRLFFSENAPLKLFLDILSTAPMSQLQELTCCLIISGWEIASFLRSIFKDRRYSMDWKRFRSMLLECNNLKGLNFGMIDEFDPEASELFMSQLRELVLWELAEWCDMEIVRVERMVVVQW